MQMHSSGAVLSCASRHRVNVIHGTEKDLGFRFDFGNLRMSEDESFVFQKEIDNLARIEWGIQLDARETKDKMIAEFIKQAKAIIKAEQSDDGDDGEDEV